MAGYKTHTLFNLLIPLPLAAGSIYLFVNSDPVYLSLFSGFFIYGTLFMSPDMDLAEKIKLFSLRGLLSLPFRFYSLFFRHRGLSHSLWFGTLTRILWLFGFCCLLLYLYGHALPTKKGLLLLLKTYQKELAFAFSGLFFADFSHLLLDGEILSRK